MIFSTKELFALPFKSQNEFHNQRNMRILITALLLFIGYTSMAQQPKLEIFHLTGDFYVYTTSRIYDGKPFPANGMYLLTDEGAVLFDMPWDTTQTQPLIDSIKIKHGKDVLLSVSTHFHDDRTGDIDYLRSKGIKTYTTRQTDDLSKAENNQRAEFLMTKDTVFTIGNHTFETYYPGHGHTPDNIVIWFEKEKILYGGCFIKSTDAKDLGNLEDANVTAWAKSVKNVMDKCKNPKFVIPGHQSWSNVHSLEHTQQLIKKQSRHKN